MVQYHSEIAKLQKSKDSLQKIVSEKKIAMSAYRFKINYFQKQLKEALEKKDSTQLVGDSILPIVDSLFLSQKQNDTSCDETIEVLQSIVANRDSSIEFQKSIEINLKELQLEQELKNQSLTAQLNKAFKDQRKKTRQNKLLSGGLLILTGITTSLLISNSLK
jgi:hypothetical protein